MYNEILEKVRYSDTQMATEKELSILIDKQNALIEVIQKENNLTRSKIKVLEDKLLLSVKQEQNPITSEAMQVCQSLSKQIDFDSLKNLFVNAESDNSETKQRALIALALIGSPEQKQKIEQVISNSEQDISLRRELIKNSDWNGYGSGLVNLFKNDKQSNIRADIISSAESSDFSPKDKVIFENTLLDNLSQEHNDVVKIATIDYFANKNPDQLNSFVNTLDMKTLSPEIKQHIQSLEIFQNSSVGFDSIDFKN